MTPLRLKRDDTPADYERYLASPGFAKREIEIPKTLAASASLGGSLSLTQFLLTWSRVARDPCISCYLSSDDEVGQRDFVSRVHGLAAVYFADKVRAENEPSANLRRNMLASAKARIDAMFRGELAETSKGSEVEMIFIQHALREFHGAFYRRAPSDDEIADGLIHGKLIRTNAEISAFAAQCFRVVNLSSGFNHLFDQSDQPIGSVLAEAFRNTCEHAYFAPDGSSFRRNLRCVRISRAQVPRSHLEKYEISSESNTEGARNYFSKLASLTSNRNRTNILFAEISIFDSGSGFAETLRASRVNNHLGDLEAVADCFKKHGTSKSSDSEGVGLHRILRAVHAANGFIRVRTSRAEAFFCGSDSYHPDMNPSEFVHACKNEVAGSLLTICFPIAY